MTAAPSDDGFDEVGPAHVAVMEQLLDGFRAGDLDAPARAMLADVVIVQPASTPFGGVHEGLASVHTMLARMAEHWSRRWNWVRRTPAGHVVVNHEEVVWTANATGKAVTLETVSLYRFRQGRIARIDVYTQDTAVLVGTLSAG